MRQVHHKETTATTKPDRERERRDDAPILDGKAVLEHLEASCETDSGLDDGGDPIKGLAIGVIVGAAIWIALAAILLLF